MIQLLSSDKTYEFFLIHSLRSYAQVSYKCLVRKSFFRSVHIVFLIMSNASHGLDLFFIISGTPKLRAVAISMICILTLDFFSGMVAAVSQRSPLALIILGFIRNSSSCHELYDYTFLGGKN